MESPNNTIHEYRTIICLYCGHTFDIPIRCGNRFCEVCSYPRRRKARDKINGVLGLIKSHPGYSLKHLTLSTVNSETIPDGVQVLITSFRRLRQRAWWKTRVRGGVFALEVTGRPSSWHVHIHAIIQARYLPYEALQKHWNRCSGGFQVYIQRIPKKQIVNYLTKYISKSSLPDQLITEVASGLKGTRLFQFFGEWHGLSNTIKPEPSKCPECQHSSFSVLDFIRTARPKKFDYSPEDFM